jgi:hypothetical protein
MRRRLIALEWGLIFTVGVVLAFSALWGSSYVIDDTLIYWSRPARPSRCARPTCWGSDINRANLACQRCYVI